MVRGIPQPSWWVGEVDPQLPLHAFFFFTGVPIFRSKFCFGVLGTEGFPPCKGLWWEGGVGIRPPPPPPPGVEVDLPTRPSCTTLSAGHPDISADKIFYNRALCFLFCILQYFSQKERHQLGFYPISGTVNISGAKLPIVGPDAIWAGDPNSLNRGILRRLFRGLF